MFRFYENYEKRNETVRNRYCTCFQDQNYQVVDGTDLFIV